MTKQKRNIFTVIESINNWFEASEPTTNTTEGSEGEASSLRVIGTSSDPIKNHSGVVELAGSTSNEGPWTEVAQVAPSQRHEGIERQPQAEVAASSSLSPRVAAPLAAVTGYGSGPEGEHESSHQEGRQDNRYQAGIGNEGTSDLPGPCTEAEVERQLAIDAFWRLLADAGYDIW